MYCFQNSTTIVLIMASLIAMVMVRSASHNRVFVTDVQTANTKKMKLQRCVKVCTLFYSYNLRVLCNCVAFTSQLLSLS